MTVNKIGAKLKALRVMLKPGVPLLELADRAGVTTAQWRNWETGKSGFPDDKKVIVCRVLGCRIVDLYQDAG